MAPFKSNKVSAVGPKRFVVEATDSPSIGPVYRSVLAKDGLIPPVQGIDSCWDLFLLSVEKYPNNSMLGRREIVDGKAGKYVWLTYREVFDIVMKLGNSIRSCGVEEGGKCGIYGVNCPEWIMSMEVCNTHRLTCVPLYDSLGADAVEFMICHAEVAIVFVEEKKIQELLKTCPNTTKYLRTIVSFGNVTPEQREEVIKFGLALYTWHEFLLLGENKQYDLPVKKRSDICTIMYTSGTTGDPKGVMISHHNIVSVVAGMNHVLESANEGYNEKDVYFSFLPLAHIFDRLIEECLIRHGGSIGFWRGDVKLLTQDLVELKPTIFCAVPRVLDVIYTGLKNKIASGSFLSKTFFDVAYRTKLKHMKRGMKHAEAAPLLDKIVFSKASARGNVRLIVSGAAPLAKPVETFFRVATCAHVLQGYGLTETCGASFLALPDQMDMIGTVGSPVPVVDVRLESVPEMGYDALSSTPRGEICMKGETLFSGYYKREDITKEVVVDGWFHTGDIGEWQPDGTLRIIDRKKNIFKLAQGEYVAVEKLENIFGAITDIDSIWVYGNSFESYLIAVIIPNKQALTDWAERNGVPGDFDSLCGNPKAKEYILGVITKFGKEKKLKGFELPKAVHLDPVPFDMARGHLTPTFKKKRPQLLKYYQNVIDEMYKKSPTAQSEPHNWCFPSPKR